MTWETVNAILFAGVTLYGVYLFYLAVYRRLLYMKLGKPAAEFKNWRGGTAEGEPAGDGVDRRMIDFKRRAAAFFSEVFGQRKLLKDRKSGAMHAVIFYGFIVVQFGALDLIVKGLGAGGLLPRAAWDGFGLVQEITVLLILVAIGYAAWRRYGEKLPRLKRGWKPGIVVWFIVCLMLSVLLSLAFDRLWHEAEPSGYAPLSSALAALFAGVIDSSAAQAAFYVCWWMHLLVLLAFLVYVPQSKHFHLIVAPVNLWFRRREPAGLLRKLDLEDEEAESFGAGRIEDFTRKQMLDFYACVECGRCTSVCPAAAAGKTLSPMHLITKLRDHLTEKGAAVTGKSPWVPALVFASGSGTDVGKRSGGQDGEKGAAGKGIGGGTGRGGMHSFVGIDGTGGNAGAGEVDGDGAGGDVEHGFAGIDGTGGNAGAGEVVGDGAAVHAVGAQASLIGDVMTEAEIWACTTCRNCEDQCPVGNEHVDKIVDLRRHLVLMEGSMPREGQRAMQNIERQGNPWGLSRGDRTGWTGDVEGVRVPTVRERPGFDYLFFVGSMGSYDLRARRISRDFVRLLDAADVSFAILGNEERNSGDTPRRLGNEMLFQQLAAENIETFRRYNVRRIVTACPHTFNTFKNEYPEFGLDGVEVLHHTQLLDRLVREGRLVARHAVKERITYHDSCYLGRYNGVYEEPRHVLRAIPGVELVEMARNRENGMCCGAGGGLMWMEEGEGEGGSAARVNLIRTEQALAVQPTVISSACPYCLTMMEDGTKMKGVDSSVQARDVAELLAMSVFGD